MLAGGWVGVCDVVDAIAILIAALRNWAYFCEVVLFIGFIATTNVGCFSAERSDIIIDSGPERAEHAIYQLITFPMANEINTI